MRNEFPFCVSVVLLYRVFRVLLLHLRSKATLQNEADSTNSPILPSSPCCFARSYFPPFPPYLPPDHDLSICRLGKRGIRGGTLMLACKFVFRNNNTVRGDKTQSNRRGNGMS